MIIFGSRMYGKKNVVKGVGACPHCGAYTSHTSYDGRKFGHLYFIPLIPAGGAVRVMKECVKCKMGSHMPRGNVQVLYQRIEALMQPCILAAGEGRRKFTDPEHGDEVHGGSFLLDAVDLLYTAGHGGEIDQLIGLLDNDAARFEHAIASGAMFEIQGRAPEAYAQYEVALQAAPEDPLPALLMADFCTRAGKHEDALTLMERARSLDPDNVQILLAMATPLEMLGRFRELSALLDQAAAMAPGLEQDKGFTKLRKKIAKKAVKSER
ncbi:MAG: tetratricopeptide repeat protein [Phycisphaerales bacterium JB063]